jgi:hypothetical protein
MTATIRKNSVYDPKNIQKRYSRIEKESVLVKYCNKYEMMTRSGEFYRDASGNWKLKLMKKRRRV